MLKPKPVFFIVAVVAIGASQLVGNESTIASFAGSHDQSLRTADQTAKAVSSPTSADGRAMDAGEQLNFDQPATSSATMGDFYGDETDDGGFANADSGKDVGDVQQSSPEPTRPEVASVAPQPSSTRRADASPGGKPSNGMPDQPIDLGSSPPRDLGF